MLRLWMCAHESRLTARFPTFAHEASLLVLVVKRDVHVQLEFVGLFV